MENYIAYKHANNNWNMKRYHFHDQYEILLSLSGDAEIFVTDRCYPLRYGSLILLPQAVLHRSVAAQQEYNRYVIRFTHKYAQTLSTPETDLLRCFKSGRIYYQLTRKQTERLCALFEPCTHTSQGYGADLRHDVSFINLLLEVDEITASQSASPVDSRALKNNIAEILSYIPEHLTDDLSLDTLSEKFYLSKSHLCHLFKESTGFSPGEFIIKTRVMRARSLLLEGKSVAETCELCGFQNYTHFIRTFRQIVGVSPGKYKKQVS